jgi:hypothetical protein
MRIAYTAFVEIPAVASGGDMADQMGPRATFALWVIALAIFALLIAAGFYSLMR